MSVDELKNQGNAAAKAGDYPKAVELFTQAIAIDPNNHVLFSNRANIYVLMKEADKALADAEQCIKINPKFGKGYVRKADAYSLKDMDQEAHKALEEGAKQDPNEQLIKTRQEQLMTEGMNKMQVQVFGNSDQELFAKMQSNPKIAQMMMKDRTLYQRACAARVNPNFFQAMQSDPGMANLIMELMGLGDMMEKQQAAQQAKQGQNPAQPQQQPAYEAPQYQAPPPPSKVEEPKKTEVKAQSSEQKEAEEFKLRGNDLFKEGKYQEALMQYEQAFEAYKSITYLNNQSTALLKMEKYEEAMAKAEEAYKFGKDNPGTSTFEEMAKSLAKQGSALHKLGRYEEAIQKLKDSMLEHRDKQTLNLLNKVQDDYDEFKLKNSYNPQKAQECKSEGNALVKDNKFLEAIEKFSEGIKCLPDKKQDDNAKVLNLQLHNNRSLALFKAGQIHASYEDCVFVLAQEPQNLKALLRKAQIERMRKQYYLSVETYRQIMAIDQSNAEAIEGYQKTALKVNEMQSGMLNEKEMQEIQNIALQDPDMQKLAQDPGMSQVLQQLQTNPQQAQHFLQDPVFGRKLERLINGGIIRIGGKPKQE